MRLLIERNSEGRKALVLRRGPDIPEVRERDEPVPLEGTRMDLFNSIIPNFFAEQGMSAGAWFPGDAALSERVWVANRCIQLNAQQIASMPIEWHGPPGTDEPAWVSSPDPHWYPNGIADAMFHIAEQVYGYGYSCQYITDFYADGFPRTWTILESCDLQIKVDNGARVYKYGEDILDPRRVIQIDRNPGRVHGTSALRAYSQKCWSLLAAGNQSMSVSQGGVPQAVLKSSRKLTEDQALAIQTKWVERTSSRGGAPPVLPPELDFEALSFDPKDMALIDTQEFDAKAIMTAFGVPSTLLNMAMQGGLTYQNPAALGEQWWRFELRPTATRIANAFSAQMLPRGQWISLDAADTFAPITDLSDDDDEQLSQVAKASPSQQTPRPLTAVGG